MQRLLPMETLDTPRGLIEASGLLIWRSSLEDVSLNFERWAESSRNSNIRLVKKLFSRTEATTVFEVEIASFQRRFIKFLTSGVEGNLKNSSEFQSPTKEGWEKKADLGLEYREKVVWIFEEYPTLVWPN